MTSDTTKPAIGNTPETSTADNDPVLDVRDLSIYFQTPQGEVQAVRDSSFSIRSGEIVGMVGESGSGKSVTGLSILRLLPEHNSRVEGQITLNGRSLLDRTEKEMVGIRGREVSMIFQEPMTALDPVFTVGSQIAATLRAHQGLKRRFAKQQSIDLLGDVGIQEPAQRYHEYPHQLSGGMRQRAMIAMALICEPQLLIADEPTTALDVTIQSQILELIVQLSNERGTAVLLITHDLGVVAETCERVITMYAGQVVEQSAIDDALTSPQHPYTSGLLRAIPRAGNRRNQLYAIPGRVPLLHEMPDGCRFGPRCDFTVDRCSEPQALTRIGTERLVRCHRSEELDLPGAISQPRAG